MVGVEGQGGGGERRQGQVDPTLIIVYTIDPDSVSCDAIPFLCHADITFNYMFAGSSIQIEI